MTHYYQTNVPDDPPNMDNLDPLSRKLAMLDLQMARKNEKKQATEKYKANTLIPGNEIDEKTHQYYQGFLQVAKSFVADLRVAKISKAKEEEKPVKKPPAKPLPAPKKSKLDVIKKKESSP